MAFLRRIAGSFSRPAMLVERSIGADVSGGPGFIGKRLYDDSLLIHA